MMKIKALLFLWLHLCCVATPALADTVDIREWLVPWEKSEPTGAFMDSRGRVWFAGFSDSYIANFSPETAEFNRYDLRKGTAPAALLVDEEDRIWYASNKRRYIGMLDPGTGRVAEIEMPDRKAKQPRSLAFDQNGDIWFTVEDGNFVGRLKVDDQSIALIPVPTSKSRPYGITVNSINQPWVASSGNNTLLSIDPVEMTIAEIVLPNPDSRTRRIVTTSDDMVWYADFERGQLGRYDPGRDEFTEWLMPGGPDSRPFGMAVDRDDRLWIVETGSIPNRLIGFDAAAESFLTESDIPSGAGSVGELHYSEANGEVWFATASNYIGRAKIH
jgi:virginiamycin B lyase